jgi:hypothetical protein
MRLVLAIAPPMAVTAANAQNYCYQSGNVVTCDNGATGSWHVRSFHLAEGNFLRLFHPVRLGWPLFGLGLKALPAIRFIARTMPILANSSGPRSSAASISI